MRLARGEFATPAARRRFTEFYDQFYAYVDKEHAMVAANLARLAVASRSDGQRSPLVQASSR